MGTIKASFPVMCAYLTRGSSISPVHPSGLLVEIFHRADAQSTGIHTPMHVLLCISVVSSGEAPSASPARQQRVADRGELDVPAGDVAPDGIGARYACRVRALLLLLV